MQEKRSIEGIISSILLMLVLFIVLIQIFLRLVPMFNFVWTEELSRWTWTWVVCMGWGEVERSNQHLKMDLLQNKLSLRSRCFINIVLDSIYVLVAINLLFIGVKQVLKTLHASSVTLPFNFYILYLVLPLGILCVIVRVITRIMNNIRKLKKLNYTEDFDKINSIKDIQ